MVDKILHGFELLSQTFSFNTPMTIPDDYSPFSKARVGISNLTVHQPCTTLQKNLKIEQCFNFLIPRLAVSSYIKIFCNC